VDYTKGLPGKRQALVSLKLIRCASRTSSYMGFRKKVFKDLLNGNAGFGQHLIHTMQNQRMI
jgi:hypothetical protein